MRVPFAAESVSMVRVQVHRWLSEADASPECNEDACLIVSELVANSVRHAEPLADGSIFISWSIDMRGVEISVSDGGSPTRPHTIDASPSALAGRGMAIIDRLSVHWWAERTESRSTVHVVLRLR